MEVATAQQEVREVYLGGSVGQTVSGVLWLLSAALGTWGTPRGAVTLLIVGGFFIFPLTQLGLKLMGRPASLSPVNPLRGLAMQVAFTLPLCLPLVGAAALYRLDWFYPAFMVLLGAHYLPFTFLYGMRMFIALAGILILAGLALGLYIQGPFAVGAWITGFLLLGFAAAGRMQVANRPPAGG